MNVTLYSVLIDDYSPINCHYTLTHSYSDMFQWYLAKHDQNMMQ